MEARAKIRGIAGKCACDKAVEMIMPYYNESLS
jgi:hypothetical protein